MTQFKRLKEPPQCAYICEQISCRFSRYQSIIVVVLCDVISMAVDMHLSCKYVTRAGTASWKP